MVLGGSSLAIALVAVLVAMNTRLRNLILTLGTGVGNCSTAWSLATLAGKWVGITG